MATTEATPRRTGLLYRALCALPGLGWFTTRRRRRPLVVAFVLDAVALPLTGWLTDSEVAVLALVVPFALLTVYLGGSTRAIMDRPLALLDEHERHLRHTVLRNPYITGAGLGLASGVVVATAQRSGSALASGLVIAVVAGLLALPTVLLAWRWPDEVDDDETAG